MPGIIGLAALGVPRVVAHDLGLVGPVGNALLVFVPLAIWLAIVLWRRVPNPFLTLLVVGLAYGVLLGLTHQVLWTEAFPGGPPSLSGNLVGTLPPSTEAVVLRIFAFGSSLLTGVLNGAASGAVGWLLAKMVSGLRRRK
ncbi:hypothetical protein BS330_12665 [Amycolatopsis keratiniphila subsp. nogabecina]|uniref:Uncharacterized protein n=1 Tax=Amycolatopsis keratiniphila subsp. keratiniphila TaxID=227715 RepID=A0A1W2LVX4_9PSEU|nr:hypothetical protein BS330_12665 [Amycolatopsis keratiniphila subsp. nogabecina]ONF70425.1 hypothetical protein AVR91_0216515 [Amycolatopsis keratiniphila subsp. keratiniphila]